MNQEKNDFFLFSVLPLPWQSLKGSILSEIWAKVFFFFFKAFIKSEQLRRLLNDQNDWYNVLGNGRLFWKKNLMTPSMAYSVSVWFISATNGCYESDDISLKWIRSVIPSGSFVIFYPNPMLFLFLWPFDVLVKNIAFFCSVVQLYDRAE